MQELLERLSDAPEWMKLFIIASSTLVSEDLTTIYSGVLVSQDSLSWSTAILGCFFGIFIGDGLLYLVGLLVGRPALKLPIIRSMVTPEKVDKCAKWFEVNGMAVVITSRFIPGTRLPTYFAAGLMGARARYFLLAAAIAVAIWTPLLVAASYFFGEQIEQFLNIDSPMGWIALVLGGILLFILLRLLMNLANRKSRKQLFSRLYRIIRWEFWPILPLYAPIILYNIYLAFRYRRLFLPLIANPGIDYSGYVGESKSDIMDGFKSAPQEFFPKDLHLKANPDPQTQKQAILDWLQAENISFPIVVKPEFGHRGNGVAKVQDEAELLAYLEEAPINLQIQEFAKGPYEFGVFYRRFPDEPHGEILGLTGKEFPYVVGDGKTTLEDLILNSPDCMGRIRLFFEKHANHLEAILPVGEIFSLTDTGNHCLGTLFTDKCHLLTPELNQQFDLISQSMAGFYIGRYDVRAENLEDFRRGKAFKIIELNGAAGEPGHMYDASHSIFYAWKTLRQQYRDLWKIGKQNEQRGVKPISPVALFNALRDYKQKSYKS